MAYPNSQPAEGQLAPFVLNPPVPYTSAMYGGPISPGRLIFIQGSVPAVADRFHVNLQCGASTNPKADVALHFNPRFGAPGKGVCVRNSLLNRKWGREERDQSHFPFAFNENFEIIILCEANQFKVAVNGQHFIEYDHHIKNLNLIDTIVINGKVHVHSIRFQEQSAGYIYGSGSIFNPPMPYTGPVVGGMTPGRLIFLSGKVQANPDRFHVNLQCGVGESPHPDVAFRFCPHFQDQTVVRNTLKGQSWGSGEKNVSYFPFAANGFFEMIILCEENCFKVAVNGQHFLEYAHRMPLESVNTLMIKGTVEIHHIHFQ